MTKNRGVLNYQGIPDLSVQRSKSRIEKANHILGPGVVLRILGFALYLLGANRTELARFLDMPLDTLKSLLQRSFSDGLPALEDRRHKSSTFLPPAPAEFKPRLLVEEDSLVIHFDERSRIKIPRQNPIQCRTVLLTMMRDNLLSLDEVAQGLGLSSDRLRKLNRELLRHDVQALLDQRKGQRQNYRVSPEVKAELIQQYVLNLQAHTATSSEQLSKDLAQRCQIRLAARTIRLHVAKLGLGQIRNSLPQLLATVKKTQPSD